MKKIILLVTAALAVVSVQGQQSSNAVIPSQQPNAFAAKVKAAAHPTSKNSNTRCVPQGKANLAHKTTNGTTYMDWYNLWAQNYQAGQSTGYYFNTYQDSNTYDNTSTTTDFVFFHGMGMSFDPTDDAYYATATAYQVSAPMPDTVGYTVDSFFAPVSYVQNDATNNGDSLIVEFAVVPTGTPANGVFALQFGPSDTCLDITADSTPRFCTGLYTPASNEMYPNIQPVAQPLRFAFPFNSTNIYDTDANGFNEIYFALPNPLTVPAGSKVVSFMHPKSGVAYTLGTDLTNANYFKMYAGLPGGTNAWWPQTPHNSATGYPGSYQSGLASTTQGEYAPYFSYMTNPLLVPSVAYTFNPDPAGYDVPQCAFHVIWTATADTSTGPNGVKVTNVLNNHDAYPNPANSEVSITFSTNQLANVTVEIMNTLGQAVKVQEMGYISSGRANFNTSDLASGLYFYDIIANGERTTGRITISH
jgi:hypothetical protein